jgi:hypothetical protein
MKTFTQLIAALTPALLLCATVAHANSAETVYTNQHDVLVAAIKNGSAQGVMGGQVAEKFTRQFSSTSPLLVNAKVISALAQADCKRLEIIFTKKDIDTPKGKTDAILKTQVNYCIDGSPPIPTEK